MRIITVFPILLMACSNEANHIGNPLLLPLSGLANVAGNAVYRERRGRVEVFVKTNHPALVADITRQGGPTLTQAMDIAGVPVEDRPARLIQMRSDVGLYQTSPAALVVTLMVYGG